MSTGATVTATANGATGTCPRSNHWIERPAAPKEILIAAAVHPLRYVYQELRSHMKVFLLSVLLVITTMTGARAEAVWDTADRDVVRVSPARIPGLPKTIVQEMKRRECLIPQTYISSQTHNAIRGSFQKKGTKDWAILCSKKQVSSVLVFWGGSPNKVDEILSSPDKNWLQGIDEKRIGFSRYIGRIEPPRISEYQRRDDGSKPPPFSHDGIGEAFLEKASTIHYYDKGVWTEISGAD